MKKAVLESFFFQMKIKVTYLLKEGMDKHPPIKTKQNEIPGTYFLLGLSTYSCETDLNLTVFSPQSIT